MGLDSGVTVVVVTRNRIDSLRVTLAELSGLVPTPEIMVVDNGSTDGTTPVVAAEFPHVSILTLGRNLGSTARNLGVAAARTGVVAFADDDSSWAPGSLERARHIFAEDPRLGLVAARILVGPGRRLDPTCRAMEHSPLGSDGKERPRILGFVACGAVVRRRAFYEAGGFEPLLFFMGEEAPLALDMAARGWDLVYAPEVVALHRPESVARASSARRRRLLRNRLLSSVIHDPWDAVWRETRRLLAGTGQDADVRAALAGALLKGPEALARRRPVPGRLVAARRLLETDGKG